MKLHLAQKQLPRLLGVGNLCPFTMNNDPADERAKARRLLGLTRELQAERAELPDPARGGTRGYAVHTRRNELQRVANGDAPAFALRASIYRWQQRLNLY